MDTLTETNKMTSFVLIIGVQVTPIIEPRE